MKQHRQRDRLQIQTFFHYYVLFLGGYETTVATVPRQASFAETLTPLRESDSSNDTTPLASKRAANGFLRQQQIFVCYNAQPSAEQNTVELSVGRFCHFFLVRFFIGRFSS